MVDGAQNTNSLSPLEMGGGSLMLLDICYYLLVSDSPFHCSDDDVNTFMTSGDGCDGGGSLA